MSMALLNFSIPLFLAIAGTLSEAPSACPNSCYCDDSSEYVSCVGDGIWRLPADIPRTTVRLELRNYMTRVLSAEDMDGLENLVELKLQQSHVQVIENGTFYQNRYLEQLDLSQNNLSSVGSAAFHGLAKLRVLELFSNGLQEIDEAFVDLVNLEVLDLHDNRITQLSTRTFTGLHKVQYMNLDANNISYIEVGTFQYLTNLAHLIISNNPLNALSRLDFFGSRLQFIDISHVGLDRVPQSLTKFVRDLRLAKNNLTRISAGDFDSYPYLGLLVLDDNCVSEIENDALGRQEYLMRLWLNGNCLTQVPPNLPPSLLALYVEENRLTDIPSYSFKGLVHLERLFLQRNKIQNLEPCAFCDLVSLKSLDLQANEIENLTNGVFANLSRLETLDLSQNSLKVIDSKCFDGLGRLKTLQLSRIPTNVQVDEAMLDPLQNLQTLEVYDSAMLVHRIFSSTRMMHGLRKIQELNIMHNRIVRLRSDFPSFLPNLKTMKMSGNLWHCDKDIAWLVMWIKQSNIQFYGRYSIRCATPHKLQYKPLLMLADEDFEEATTEAVSPSTYSLTVQPSTTSITYPSSSVTSPVSSSPTEREFTDGPAMISSTTLGDETAPSTPETSSTTLVYSTLGSFAESPTKVVFPNVISSDPYRYKILHMPQTSGRISTRPALSTAGSVHSSFSDFRAAAADEGIVGSPTQLSTTTSAVTSTPHESANTYFVKTVTPVTGRFTEAETASMDFDSNKSRSSERKVLSSRLRGWTVEETTTPPPRWNSTTTVLVAAVVAVGSLLLLVGGLVTLLTLMRCRHRYQPVKHKNMRRSSSISYYPQKDEVSIVTLTEGTVGLRTNSHHGVGNKLYYIMENGNANSSDVTRDALPDPQLQELLPRSSADCSRVY